MRADSGNRKLFMNHVVESFVYSGDSWLTDLGNRVHNTSCNLLLLDNLQH